MSVTKHVGWLLMGSSHRSLQNTETWKTSQESGRTRKTFQKVDKNKVHVKFSVSFMCSIEKMLKDFNLFKWFNKQVWFAWYHGPESNLSLNGFCVALASYESDFSLILLFYKSWHFGSASKTLQLFFVVLRNSTDTFHLCWFHFSLLTSLLTCSSHLLFVSSILQFGKYFQIFHQERNKTFLIENRRCFCS